MAYAGFVTAADLPRLRELWTLPFHSAFRRPYRVILDGAHLSGIDGAAFEILVENVRMLANTPGLIDIVAYIPPPNMVAATTLGLFHQHVVRLIDLRFVEDLDAAVSAVGAEDYREELVELRDVVRGAGLLTSLRALLREDPRLSLEEVARRLAVSTRTLQRVCTTSSSSFRNETASARFAFADELLRTTADKIESVARRAGYSSATTFARRFRAVYGITPAELRASDSRTK